LLISIYADLMDPSGGFGNFGSSNKDREKKSSKYFSDYKSDRRDDVCTFLKHFIHLNLFIFYLYLFGSNKSKIVTFLFSFFYFVGFKPV